MSSGEEKVTAHAAKHRLKQDLHRWWMDRAEDEANQTVEKAVEYGARSMVEVGHQMAKMQGRTVDDEEAAEMACYFYIIGKVGRWSDALARGERVSQDTLFDVGVYVRMAQRIRSNGGWPGVTLDEAPRPVAGRDALISREAAYTVLPWGPNDGREHHPECAFDTDHAGVCKKEVSVPTTRPQPPEQPIVVRKFPHKVVVEDGDYGIHRGDN